MEHSLAAATGFAAVVKGHLDRGGISQREAATRTGIPLTTLHRRLTGASPFSVNELLRIASLLDTTVSRLAIEAESQGAA